MAQWIERPPGAREVMGLIPVGESDFFFVPRSCHVDQFTFPLISLPSSRFTIFIHLSQDRQFPFLVTLGYASCTFRNIYLNSTNQKCK